jgi:hypothetical protein
MSDPKANDPQGAEQPSSRRPYVKPAFSSEPVFETKALQCGGNLSGGLCLHGQSG